MNENHAKPWSCFFSAVIWTIVAGGVLSWIDAPYSTWDYVIGLVAVMVAVSEWDDFFDELDAARAERLGTQMFSSSNASIRVSDEKLAADDEFLDEVDNAVRRAYARKS